VAGSEQALAAVGDDQVADIIRDGLTAHNRAPRYEQVIHLVEQAIRDGRLAPGAALPPEPELAAQVGLSRRTIRQAWNDLARRGLIVRRRGIGTFVARPAIEQPLGRLSSFVETLAREGSLPDITLLGVRLTVDRDASPLLYGHRDGVVFEISRLFKSESEPIVLETIFLPLEIGQLLPGEQLGAAVIDDLLESAAGILVDRGEETLRMTRLGRADAALLQASPGEPAFLVQRTALAEDRIVEMRRSLIRADRAQFHIALQGRQRSTFSQPEPLEPSEPGSSSD
jgi:GntR family transcriptional regulator